MAAPRRSTRVPTKKSTSEDVPPTDPPSTSRKRKAPPPKDSHEDPASFDYLLSNPKSALVTLELPTLINENTWMTLSDDNRVLLSTMLPPTVFPFFRPALHPQHPAHTQRSEEETDENRMDLDAMALASEPDLSFLTDPFFETDAKAFQDHLYSGWLTPAHETMVQGYTEKVIKGDAHAVWKDEVWAAEHPATDRDPSAVDGLAGEASSLTLRDLTKHSIIHIGDILAYRRSFSQLNITVAKDVLIHAIHPSTGGLTVLVAPSTQTHLPPAHLTDTEMETDDDVPVLEIRITNPSQLEGALLDVDARVEKGKRPNGNAWKCVGVWRLREGDGVEGLQDSEVGRGSREYRGTLFYLRGCFYDDQ